MRVFIVSDGSKTTHYDCNSDVLVTAVDEKEAMRLALDSFEYYQFPLDIVEVDTSVQKVVQEFFYPG